MQDKSITSYESTKGYNQYYCMDLPRGHNIKILLTSFPKPGYVTQQLKKMHIKCKVPSTCSWTCSYSPNLMTDLKSL